MDLLEQIAEKLHVGWMQARQRAEVIYGPSRTATSHPHLVYWNNLGDIEAQNQDRFQAALILRAWASQEVTKEALPALIHDSWVIWEQVHGRFHRHALPFQQAHPNGPDEHAGQAELVWAILSMHE